MISWGRSSSGRSIHSRICFSLTLKDTLSFIYEIYISTNARSHNTEEVINYLPRHKIGWRCSCHGLWWTGPASVYKIFTYAKQNFRAYHIRFADITPARPVVSHIFRRASCKTNTLKIKTEHYTYRFTKPPGGIPGCTL